MPVQGPDDLIEFFKKVAAMHALARRARARLMQECSTIYGRGVASDEANDLVCDLLNQYPLSTAAIETTLRRLAAIGASAGPG